MKRICIIILFIMLLLLGYSLVMVRCESGSMMGVEIDLAKPQSIVWPCEIACVGDQGEMGMRIPPKVGRGWKNEAGGAATYKFFIPQKATYYLWVFSKWQDACTNAIYANIDDSEKIIIGNDPVYNQWHWVRGVPVGLKPGTHTLVLSNHSDNIEMQKVCLVNTDSADPEDFGLIASDLFYDGFDGCDEGNFMSWKGVFGNWRVMDPSTQSCKADNVLRGVSEDEALIIYENEAWEKYAFNVELKIESFQSGESEIGLCIGVKDPNHYYRMDLVPAAGESGVQIIITDCTPERNERLGVYNCSIDMKEWHAIEIRLMAASIEYRIDAYEIQVVPIRNIIRKGGVGLYLKGNTSAYFDNIHVRDIKQLQGEE